MKKTLFIALGIGCFLLPLTIFANGKSYFAFDGSNGHALSFFKQPITIFVLATAIVTVAIAIPFLILSSKNDDSEKGSRKKQLSSAETKSVVVVEKRIASPSDILVNLYLVLFQDECGKRIELTIENTKEFDRITVGDKGILTFSGKRFFSFDKELNEIEKTKR